MPGEAMTGQFIDLYADGGTMEFAPVIEVNSLTANPWQWISFSSPVEQYQVENPEKYTLTFVQDGSLVINADCNVVLGKYTTEGATIKIELGPSTLAACPEGSRSDQFLKNLQSAAIYGFEDDVLNLDLMMDGGTMTLTPFDPMAAFRVKTWQELLEKAIQTCDAPGAILLADTPKGRFLNVAGLSSVEDNTPMQATDRLEIGSNTKSFTTVLALLLQEDGVWSLDDPLNKWLPDQAAKIPNGGKVTLRQLGQNHTGIPDYADPIIGKAIMGSTFDQASLEKGYTPEELVDFALSSGTPSFEPGQGWEYSTTNFILLGLAIEKATGKPISELYQQRIFDPLGMQDTFLLNDIPEPGSVVNGYYTMENKQVVNVTTWNGSQGWAGGSLVSTAEDMAKYMQGLASGKVFKSPDSLKQLTSFGDGIVASFLGYGLGVGKWGDDPFGWGHAGQTPGFQSAWAIYPEKQVNVVFLTNSGTCSANSLLTMIQVSPELFESEIP